MDTVEASSKLNCYPCIHVLLSKNIGHWPKMLPYFRAYSCNVQPMKCLAEWYPKGSDRIHILELVHKLTYFVIHSRTIIKGQYSLEIVSVLWGNVGDVEVAKCKTGMYGERRRCRVKAGDV